jgi:hypothetical protein
MPSKVFLQFSAFVSKMVMVHGCSLLTDQSLAFDVLVLSGFATWGCRCWLVLMVLVLMVLVGLDGVGFCWLLLVGVGWFRWCWSLSYSTTNTH